MKVICEYCGTQIDINKDNLCPSCGASFAHNASYKRIKEHKKRHEDIELKQKETELENRRLFHQSISNVTGTFKNVSNTFRIVFPIILILVISVIVFVFYNISKQINNFSENKDNAFSDLFNDVNNIDSEMNKKVTVGLNEFGETSEYRVKVDTYKTIEKYPFKIADGYKVVTFHFVVENLTGENYWLNDSINCVVNGIAQTSKHDFDRDELPSSIAKELTVHGYKAFEVPVDAESYDIKFGDYVTIHIEL